MGNLLKQASDIISLLAPEYTVPGDMQVLKKKIYRGPHLHSATPMIAIQLDLGQIEHGPPIKSLASKKNFSRYSPALKTTAVPMGITAGWLSAFRREHGLGM
jgi:hypothetical protein